MSEFRDLQAKLEKIEESYYKDLDIDLQELRIANKTLSPVELVSLARQRFGQDAATYLSNQLEREGDLKDYRKRNQTYFKEEEHDQIKKDYPSSLRRHDDAYATYKHPDDIRDLEKQGEDDFWEWTGKYPTLDEDFHSEDPISVQIKSLLAQGKKIMSRISGSYGEVIGTEGNLLKIRIRGATDATPAAINFDNKNNVEIVGNIDHYDVIEHTDYPDEVDEAKWDYKKTDKGRGAGTDSPMYDGGAKNRKNRKAFRKAEKAKAHQARMRGEIDEEFELDEARGRVVEVPPELRGTSVGSATSRDAERFLADLGPDDDVSHDVVDPETGELLDWPTTGELSREDAAYWRAQGGTKRERGQAKYKASQRHDFDAVPILHLSKEGPEFGEGQDIAWQFLSELRDSDFYNVVWRDIADDVEDPEMMRSNDYDIDVEIPVLLKRKDGKKLTDDDHDNIKEIMKAVKAASTLGNIGIGYAGTTDEGTTARFHAMFH